MPNALGLGAARYLRKLVPPQTLMLVLATLEAAGAAITMKAAGTATEPGYETRGTVYLGVCAATDLVPSIDGSGARLRQINGYCI